jgi:hypothetical protein
MRVNDARYWHSQSRIKKQQVKLFSTVSGWLLGVRQAPGSLILAISSGKRHKCISAAAISYRDSQYQ